MECGSKWCSESQNWYVCGPSVSVFTVTAKGRESKIQRKQSLVKSLKHVRQANQLTNLKSQKGTSSVWSHWTPAVFVTWVCSKQCMTQCWAVPKRIIKTRTSSAFLGHRQTVRPLTANPYSCLSCDCRSKLLWWVEYCAPPRLMF